MKTCIRCGKRLPEQRIYSRWTRSYYCTNIDACTRRARRSTRKRVAR